MSQEELEYYRNRARTEAELAATSTNRQVAEIHRKLAALYEELVRVEEGPRKSLGMVA